MLSALALLCILFLSPAGPAAAGFSYYDEWSLVEFTIPEGWMDFTDEDDYYLWFTPESDDSCFIYYDFYDLYADLDEVERAMLRRAELDNSFYSFSYLEELGFRDISMALYGGAEYYSCAYDYGEAHPRADGEYERSLLHIRDGILYDFSYIYYEGADLYADYEALVASVIYPAYEEVAAFYDGDLFVPSPAPAELPTPVPELPPVMPTLPLRRPAPAFTARAFFMGLLLTLAFYLIPLALLRFGIRRRPLRAQAAVLTLVGFAVVAFVTSVITFFLARVNITGALCGIVLWSGGGYALLRLGAGRGAPSPALRPPGQDIAPPERPFFPASPPPGAETQARLCPLCGAKQPVGRTTCLFCAADLDDGDPERPRTGAKGRGAASENGARRCGACGTPISPGAAFCARCGQPAKSPRRGTGTEENPKNSGSRN